MKRYLKHYINGEWVESTGSETTEVINPATEEAFGEISLGTKEDLDKAVQAARDAFPHFSQMPKEERVKMLEDIAEEYNNRKDDIIDTITEELGSPVEVSEKVHFMMGYNHFAQAAESLKSFSFVEEYEGHTRMKEASGVSGLITPWNFPTNQTSTKIASAFAAGSPVVLKPAEQTPFAAFILTEIFDKVGVPKGVFNLVNGTGEVIGDGISSHKDIDFVSFTGSGATGEKIMKNAAENITNIALELGGKSPLIVLDDADVKDAARTALTHITNNTGQVCSAATRTLIPSSMKDEFEQAIKDVLPEFKVGDPHEGNHMGPIVSQKQWDTVQSYMEKGTEEGATLLVGGPGKPEGLEQGYYAKPTVFTDVDNGMVIAREEIFGPVMCVLTYDSLDEAIEIANDTEYGLAGYVYGKDKEKLRKASAGIRAGRVKVNDTKADFAAPFGGYKHSGIGREWGDHGIEEYLEVKTILGYPEK
ncbi:aldehyde dehydrogenase family protein [Salimicrobium jeotgali]|uniref:Aldehyde dehydrogenase n=1 Tax=Salimicrobium jeotgali TaxID=1230341 RepID=K2H9Q8_9BACI|nr:aldehyde dehydrogenase family protein [Salimicrobium jeotgali]AKG05224.1 aldehyde dehydrogenase family protein [Salimicrobium jeotgali]EKE32395.1 aldehyde dehydrogenase [Salimicrobium jeotgali]MBM7695626.1 aldehyde dehydrogenase (NAD+) [Salimicrobium jeotgali]